MWYLWRKDLWVGLTPHDCPEWAIAPTIEECYQDFMSLLVKYGLTIGEDDQNNFVSKGNT
jgi:hypothetical protein